MDILALFACFETLALTTQIRQLAIISQAIFAMTGRITMLSISRWTSKGGSYRTIQRFFASSLPWTEMKVKFFQSHLFNRSHEYILAGDETVIGKSGSETFGLERFFSGLQGKVIRGLSFLVWSLIDTQERQSYPLLVEQRIKTAVPKKNQSPRRKKPRAKRRKGRPAGSRNRDKREFQPSAEVGQLDRMLALLVKLLRVFVAVKYLALDGHFGHQQAVLLCQRNELELISKLRRDAVLFEKYEGKSSGRGAKKKYGPRLRFDLMPPRYLQKSEKQADQIINYYAGSFWHKEFAEPLKVVVIVKIDVKKQKLAHSVLFSSDESLEWEKLIDYYGLRFQIEFNFRDAKQHFGLEDFMTTTKAGVENAANLSLMMLLLSAKLLKNKEAGVTGINDLKTHYRGAKYALLVLKKVLPKPEPILIKRIIEEVGRLGSIHRTEPVAASA